jgi:multiple sugar transport system permease protein
MTAAQRTFGGPRAGRLANATLYLVLVLGALTMITPLLWMLITSLKPLEDVFKWPPLAFQSAPVWENYREIWRAVPFGRYLANTFLVSTARTAGVLVTSSLAGYAFARLRFPGRDAIFLAYLGTIMVPGQVTMIPSFIVMRELGWLDTYMALIVPWLFSPFGTFLMRQYFLTLPRSLEDAAAIDGAGLLTAFRRIALPLAKPALATLAVFTFLTSWNDFLWPLIVTDSREVRVVSVGLTEFQDLYYTDWPLLMAASLVAVVPVLVLYMFAQRYFVAGIATTGQRG